METLRLGLVGNYQSGKSTLVNCLLERPIATIGEGVSTTHVVVNYQYGKKERIEYVYNSGLKKTELNANLEKNDTTFDLREINVYLNSPFLEAIVLTDMPGFGSSKVDDKKTEAVLSKIDFAIVVATNDKVIEENSDMYKNVERLRRYNVPFYIVLNCTDTSYPNWTPLYKNNIRIATQNINRLWFYKPLTYPFEEGECIVSNFLWYWYSISKNVNDLNKRDSELFNKYNDLLKYSKADICVFSNFSNINKIFTMDNRVYLELRKDLKEQIRKLKDELCPIGTIQAFAYEKIPKGWLPCNGDKVHIESYPELFKVIGTRFGGNGEKDFQLPDLRDKFIRGWGMDNNVREFGTTQNDALQGHGHKSEPLTTTSSGSHTHRVYYCRKMVGSNTFSDNDMETRIVPTNHVATDVLGADPGTKANGSHTHVIPSFEIKEIVDGDYWDVRVDYETRPKNLALLFCIKALP